MGDHCFCGGIANTHAVLVDNFDHCGTGLGGRPRRFFFLGPKGGRPLSLYFLLTFTLKWERSTISEISLPGAGLAVDEEGGVVGTRAVDDAGGAVAWIGIGTWMILFFFI